MENREKHILIVARLHVALNIFHIIAAIIGLIFFDTTIPPLIFIIFSMIGIMAAVGLFFYQRWGRVFALVMSFIYLFMIPHGTIVGIYTMIVLFDRNATAALGGKSTTVRQA